METLGWGYDTDIVAGTPYEGGYFRVKFNFGPDYPNLPPKCMSPSISSSPCSPSHYFQLSSSASKSRTLNRPSRVISVECGVCHSKREGADWVGTMITRIFHPNVSKAGEICVDTLKKGWDRKYGIGHVLVVSAVSLCLYRYLPSLCQTRCWKGL